MNARTDTGFQRHTRSPIRMVKGGLLQNSRKIIVYEIDNFDRRLVRRDTRISLLMFQHKLDIGGARCIYARTSFSHNEKPTTAFLLNWYAAGTWHALPQQGND